MVVNSQGTPWRVPTFSFRDICTCTCKIYVAWNQENAEFSHSHQQLPPNNPKFANVFMLYTTWKVDGAAPHELVFVGLLHSKLPFGNYTIYLHPSVQVQPLVQRPWPRRHRFTHFGTLQHGGAPGLHHRYQRPRHKRGRNNKFSIAKCVKYSTLLVWNSWEWFIKTSIWLI